jgi:D-serine deaminase-like pyridoxal phosphate-dependent protein
VAKLGEAEAFADAGLDDLVMANTTVGPANAARAARLAARLRFAIGVDHARQVDDLAAAARAEGVRLPVRVEIDLGAGRGGVAPEEAPAFTSWAREVPGLRLQGLYAYEGFTYDVADRGELHRRHRDAQRRLADLAERLAPAFPDRPVVSLGSTPSLSAEVPLLPRVDEIRPGTYPFLDAAQAALAGGLDRCAAHVLATVVSRVADRAVLDAGSKSLTSDARAAGVCATRGHGVVDGHDLVLARLSEEHGVIDGPGAAALEVGERVRIVPNHVCPVVNLFDRLVLVRAGRVTRVLPVATRGAVA